MGCLTQNLRKHLFFKKWLEKGYGWRKVTKGLDNIFNIYFLLWCWVHRVLLNYFKYYCLSEIFSDEL